MGVESGPQLVDQPGWRFRNALLAALAIFSLLLLTHVADAATLPVQTIGGTSGEGTPRLLVPPSLGIEEGQAVAFNAVWDGDESISYAWYRCESAAVESCETGPVSQTLTVDLAAVAPFRYLRYLETATNGRGNSTFEALAGPIDDSAFACYEVPRVRSAVYQPRNAIVGGLIKLSASVLVAGDCGPMPSTATADLGDGRTATVAVTSYLSSNRTNPYNGHQIGEIRAQTVEFTYRYSTAGDYRPQVRFELPNGLKVADSPSPYGPVLVRTRDQLCFGSPLNRGVTTVSGTSPLMSGIEGTPEGKLDCTPPSAIASAKRSGQHVVAVKVRNLASGWAVKYQAGSVRGTSKRKNFKVKTRAKIKSLKLWLVAPSARSSAKPTVLKLKR